MKKKIIILIFTVTALFGFNACGPLPSSIEILASPDISLPIGKDNGNLGDSLVGFIFDALSSAKTDKADVDVKTYKNYKIKNKDKKDVDVQTFIVQYNVMGDQDLNFADKLSDFTNMLDDFENIELDLDEFKNIALGDMATIGNDQDEPVNVDISTMLVNTQSTLKSNLTDQVAPSVNAPLLVGVGLNPNVELRTFVFTIEDLDSITFKEGILSIELEISPHSPSDNISIVDFSFNSIQLRERNGTNVIDGKSGGNTVIGFSGSNLMQIVKFDLANETLKNEFDIVLSGFQDHTPPQPLPVQIDLCIGSPDVENAAVKGVEGYVIKPGEEITSIINDYDIIIGFDSSFIHAVVGSGAIIFEVEVPQNEGDPNKSWIVLHDGVDLEINILQEDGDWNGLNDGSNGLINCSEGENDITGKHINTNIIQVKNSTVTLPEGKVSFMLNDDDMESGSIGVDFIPSIIIDNFSILHMKADVLTNAHPKIDTISLGEAANYLKTIHFDKVGVELKFDRVDVEGLEIMISEPNLEINTGRAFYPITENSKMETEFINTNKTLNIYEDQIHELQFEVKLRHTGDDPDILEFHNINVSEGNIKFEISYEFFFKDSWSEAVVDFSKMNQDSSFPIDGLSDIKENLIGFSFNETKSYLYIDAPETFKDLNPEITLQVKYGTGNGPNLFTQNKNDPVQKLDFELKKIPNLGTGDEYSGPAIIPGTTVYFDRILNDLPDEQIEIKYNVDLSSLTITPDMLDDLTDSESSAVKVAVIVILPMSIEATGEDGAIFSIPNMFKSMDDLFNRTGNSEDFSYLDLIKRLRLRIKLSDEVFVGGELYMKKEGEASGKELLRFPLGGRDLNIPIDSKMLNTINNTFPYKIEEMGIRFKNGDTLIIPNDLGVINLSFDAEIAYALEF